MMCIATKLKRGSFLPSHRPLSINTKAYFSTSGGQLSFNVSGSFSLKNHSLISKNTDIFYPYTITRKAETLFSTKRLNLSARPKFVSFLHTRSAALDGFGGSTAAVVVSNENLDQSKELLENRRDNKVQEEASADKVEASAQAPTIYFRKAFKNDEYQSIINDKNSSLEEKLDLLGKESGQSETPTKVYTHLMHLYGIRGDYKNAQDVYNLMMKNKVTPESRTYHALMNAYANGGELEKTIEVFEIIRKNPKDLMPHPYSILIKAYMKHKRVQDAFGVLDIMKQKMKPDVFDYTALIQACIEARNTDKAWEAYDLMKKDGCEPNRMMYTLLITSAQKRDLGRALELFDEMLNLGINPGLKAINSFLAALSSSPEYYNSSLELLNVLVTKQNYKPDNFLFSIMLRGAQMARNLSDARVFFSQIVHSNPTPADLQVAISTMYSAYSKVYPRDGKERTLDSIEINPTSDLGFLGQPAPTSVNDCTIEAQKVYNFFTHSLDKEKISGLRNRINEEFFFVLTSYNYFKEALDFYNKNFAGAASPHPNVIGSMVQMCARIRKRNAFYSVLKQADLLLTPIFPTSKLDTREKTEYKLKAQLAAAPLTSLYQSIIVGLAELGDIASALHYFEIQCQDPDLKRPHPRNYYPLFFKIVQKSKDPSYISQLNSLLNKYKPQFC